MQNLILRTLFGALYVGAVVASVFLGEYYFGILFLLFLVFAVRELVCLCGYADSRPMLTNICVASLGVYALVWLYAFMPDKLQTSYVLAYIFLILVAEVYVLRLQPEQPMRYWGTLLTSQVMVALSFASTCMILSKGKYLALLLFVVIWVNDTMAYVVGSLTAKLPNGNHKMAPSISPKKSWEGLFGGLLSALLTGWVFYALHWIDNLQHALIYASVIAVSGVFGDLMESAFKRAVGVKDSGSFLPGHGGALDRFDSLLLAAPMFLIFIYLLQ